MEGNKNITFFVIKCINVFLKDTFLSHPHMQGFYFSLNPAARTIEKGDVTDRKQLRERLQCKSFR
jgi:hypothetical protein